MKGKTTVLVSSRLRLGKMVCFITKFVALSKSLSCSNPGLNSKILSIKWSYILIKHAFSGAVKVEKG